MGHFVQQKFFGAEICELNLMCRAYSFNHCSCWYNFFDLQEIGFDLAKATPKFQDSIDHRFYQAVADCLLLN